MSQSSDRSPLVYQGRNMCLAAPAEAGQGVNPSTRAAQKHRDALRVLEAMQHEKFRVGDFDSAECEALTLAMYVMSVRIKDLEARA